jgi:hypothetical protein
MMGPTAGGMIKDWCETGVAVFTGTVEEIPRPAHAGASSNGQTVPADLVNQRYWRSAIGFSKAAHGDHAC